MALEYKAWWKLGLENYLLMIDLYHFAGDLSEADIFNFIRKYNRGDSTNKPRNIFFQLVRQKFIQQVPGATNFYEVQPLTREIVEFLEREHRFTSAKQIKVYLEELDLHRQELEKAFKDGNDVRIDNYLRDLTNNIEKLRQCSNGNRLAIINEVTKIKINEKHESSAVRYEKVTDTLHRFITPLEEMVIVDGTVDRSLQQLQVLLEHAQHEYILDRDQKDKTRRVVLQLPRVRSDLKNSFRESLDEVTPLLKSLRANLFGRGVSAILKKVDKEGPAALDHVVNKLDLPSTVFKTALFQDLKLLDFMKEAKGYEPSHPPRINHDEHNEVRVSAIIQTQLLKQFRKALPVEDSFEWVMDRYHGEDPALLLQAYKILIDHSLDPIYKEEIKTYKIKGYLVHTLPIEIKDLI
ncbi:hypothetical protein [Desulfosediminicola ganghwensis]|uniref:hypothetical protein n=1 Tax=Desulfosediminicola ganghwensis TaxID=2569540 RepID=UPI0010AC15A4|nr:hypothetical protein [Desulfosediminicola ganghwensis]